MYPGNRTFAAILVAGLLLSCSEGSEIQIGSFKAKAPSVKQAQNSLWDFYTESSKRLSAELLLAAKSGNDLLIKDLLSARNRSSYDDTPIFLSMEAKDEKGWTPLMWAVHYNHAGIVRELLEEEANADARGDDGMTPLALAIRNNNEVILKLLLDHCESIDTRDKDGTTPLMLAVENNNLEFVERLLHKRASPGIRNAKGKSSIQIAQDLENWQAVKLLMGEVEWVHIATSESGTRYYLSPQTVRRLDERSIMAWLKEYEAGAKAPNQADSGKEDVEAPHLLAQVAVQCRDQRFRRLKGWDVNAEGNKKAAKVEKNWMETLPETMGGGLVAAVCEAEL